MKKSSTLCIYCSYSFHYFDFASLHFCLAYNEVSWKSLTFNLYEKSSRRYLCKTRVSPLAIPGGRLEYPPSPLTHACIASVMIYNPVDNYKTWVSNSPTVVSLLVNTLRRDRLLGFPGTTYLFCTYLNDVTLKSNKFYYLRPWRFVKDTRCNYFS